MQTAAQRVPGVSGVVTAFQPSPELITNVESLLRQLTAVVVVDDGGGPGFDHIFAALAEAGAVIVRLPRNSGIGAALNAGIRRARECADPEYIVTVDQDSHLPAGYVQALLDAAVAARAAGIEPGLISPSRIHGNPVKRAGSRHGIALGKEPIQSGLMLPVTTLEAIGGFWEELFIDLVDTEYYFRALNAGLPTVLADAEFDHSLGTMVDARVFGRSIAAAGRPLKVRIAATWRYYYIFRNRLLVSRRYVSRNPGWVAAGIWTDLRHLLVVTLLAPGRSARLKSVFRGIADGLRGRSGRGQFR
ncbi:glycosyltransferase [Arthrobacter sp. PAMC25564]|uniref:glycosyltransferase n=1 Tax=Arthrobacter sp. PAMC25564 TaxID=2565366 RepID=UPI0010A217EE|nr:glycosyltransferase [Arthrobacter sp. PAMC25564]QCB96951.1 glycosyltransferase [Arthrobacter sp. PAMC25564]